jgi:hypothetical protein
MSCTGVLVLAGTLFILGGCNFSFRRSCKKIIPGYINASMDTE